MSKETKISSKRLIFMANHIKKFMTNKLVIKGKNNFTKLDPKKPTIVVTSHTSELDVTLVVCSLVDKFDIAITNQKIHFSIFGDPVMYFVMLIVGRDNFIPISWAKINGKRKGIFNPKDFKAMIPYVKKGKTLIIAGHNPTKSGVIPDFGAKGPAYLSQLIKECQILPVTVTLDRFVNLTKLWKKSEKPNVIIKIGKPFEVIRPEKERKFLIKTKDEEKRNKILKKISTIIMTNLKETLNK
jgi:hypothetical protein